MEYKHPRGNKNSFHSTLFRDSLFNVRIGSHATGSNYKYHISSDLDIRQEDSLSHPNRQRRSPSSSGSPRGNIMVSQNFVVDLNKPLVSQVGYLGEAYEEWVHQPIMGKEGPRFFESGFLELFTRTAWWVIPLVWVPVASWFISNSLTLGIPTLHLPLLVLLGIFVWTLAEYLLHRFLFHVKTQSYWGNTLHYLLHGCHHKHPMDSLRLVFPPAAAALFAFPIWRLVRLVCTPSTAPAVFGGILLGYVMYDCTHYYLHHGQPKSNMPKGLKKYHLNHHYRVQSLGFGITSPLWDKVFGTVPPPSKVDAKSR